MPDYNKLFRDSGLQGILDYIQSRLRAGDLSGPEALALLGSVHKRLGQEPAPDPTVYQSYSRLMESLRESLPDVHQFVVSAWSQGRKTDSRRQEGHRNAAEDTPEAPDDSSSSVPSGSQPTVAASTGQTLLEVDGHEEPEGGGESEVEEDELPRGGKVGAEQLAESGQPDSPEGNNEAGEQEGEENDAQHESSSETNLEDEEAMSEAEEPEEAEQSDSEGEPESGEEQAGDEEQPEPQDESGSGGEPSSEGGEGGEPESGQEQAEWPEIEQPEPEEPFEGLEGDAGPAPGEN